MNERMNNFNETWSTHQDLKHYFTINIIKKTNLLRLESALHKSRVDRLLEDCL